MSWLSLCNRYCCVERLCSRGCCFFIQDEFAWQSEICQLMLAAPLTVSVCSQVTRRRLEDVVQTRLPNCGAFSVAVLVVRACSAWHTKCSMHARCEFLRKLTISLAVLLLPSLPVSFSRASRVAAFSQGVTKDFNQRTHGVNNGQALKSGQRRACCF